MAFCVFFCWQRGFWGFLLVKCAQLGPFCWGPRLLVKRCSPSNRSSKPHNLYPASNFLTTNVPIHLLPINSATTWPTKHLSKHPSSPSSSPPPAFKPGIQTKLSQLQTHSPTHLPSIFISKSPPPVSRRCFLRPWDIPPSRHRCPAPAPPPTARWSSKPPPTPWKRNFTGGFWLWKFGGGVFAEKNANFTGLLEGPSSQVDFPCLKNRFGKSRRELWWWPLSVWCDATSSGQASNALFVNDCATAWMHGKHGTGTGKN